MGFDHSAYLAYGVQVDINPYDYDEDGRSPGEQVDKALHVPTVRTACPDVGYLEAGGYDDDKFFLVTRCLIAGYKPAWVSPADAAGQVEWDRQLQRIIDVMGWGHLAYGREACWFLIADTS